MGRRALSLKWNVSYALIQWPLIWILTTVYKTCKYIKKSKLGIVLSLMSQRATKQQESSEIVSISPFVWFLSQKLDYCCLALLRCSGFDWETQTCVNNLTAEPSEAIDCYSFISFLIFCHGLCMTVSCVAEGEPRSCSSSSRWVAAVPKNNTPG